jgi:hypothetical protein
MGIGAVVIAASLGLAAQEGATPRLAPKVARINLTFRNASLQDALGIIGATADITIQFAAGLPDSQTRAAVSVQLKNVTIEDALGRVLEDAGLKYSVVDAKTIRVEKKAEATVARGSGIRGARAGG